MNSLNVAFCGDSSVGKTSIIHYFANNSFDNTLQPTVAGVFKKEYICNDDQMITLEIWDTAGDERFSSVIPSFFKKSQTVVIVYDILKKASFEHLDYWVNLVQDNAPKDVNIIIAGNKSDNVENREISLNDLSVYAKKVEAFGFIETSAKTGEGITELFSLIASTYQNNKKHVPVPLEEAQGKRCC